MEQQTLSSGYRAWRMAGLVFSMLVVVGMVAFFLYAPNDLPISFVMQDGVPVVQATVSKWTHLYEPALALLGLACLLLSTEKGRRIRAQMSAPRYYAVRAAKKQRQNDAADRFCILFGWLFQIAALLYLVQDLLLVFTVPFSMMGIILIVFPALFIIAVVGAVRILKK